MRKIQGTDTPDFSQPPLCETCVHSTQIQGEASTQAYTYCSDISTWIKFKVTECSAFEKKGTMTLERMFAIAFVLIKKKGEPIGFVRADKLDKDALEDYHRERRRVSPERYY